MTTYERIREIRNKMFPDDGIIKEMDKVVFLGNIYYAGKRDTRDYDDSIVLIEIDDITRHVRIAGNRGNELMKIKKEVSLNDILLMMVKNTDFGIKNDGNCYDTYIDELLFNIDLTLPIQDQYEETLIKILSLIE